MLYLQIYLQITLRVQKYGGFLLNCAKISLTALCWSSQQSTLQVDFKVESVAIAIQEKENEILYIASHLFPLTPQSEAVHRAPWTAS